MSLGAKPVVLMVDDSEAILAFGREVLSRHHQVHTESRGDRAIEAARRVRPALILLDLSMPGMDGDEVLRRLKADPELARVPVLVMSSEHDRADECLDLGAVKFLPKPVKGENLTAQVAEVLAAQAAMQQRESVAVLRLEVASLCFGVPIERVRLVAHQSVTLSLPFGPTYLREVLELKQQFIPVLDLAARFGISSGVAYEDRVLVVLDRDRQSLVLAAEKVHPPEEIGPESFLPQEKLAPGPFPDLQQTLLGIARTPTGALPVIEPFALIGPASLARVPEWLQPLTEKTQAA